MTKKSHNHKTQPTNDTKGRANKSKPCILFNPIMADINAFLKLQDGVWRLRLFDGADLNISSEGWSLIRPSMIQPVVFFSSGRQCLRCLPRALNLVSSQQLSLVYIFSVMFQWLS